MIFGLTSTVNVYGVDLFPPPQSWVPPNCLLEVDDVTKIPWTFDKQFDLIHLRWMIASFSREEYKRIYAEAYRYFIPILPLCPSFHLTI